MQDLMYQIYKYGTYYNPASNHYSFIKSSKPINVICDKCKTENLNVCVGYKDCDLCLRCINQIDNNYKTSTPMYDDFDTQTFARSSRGSECYF